MVLLVDDDQDLRDSIADLLRQRGYHVTTAEDGYAAMSIITGNGVPCIVLLDLVMPGMDGWQFLGAMQNDPHLAAIPIVIASAHAATHAPPAGAIAVLHKPFDFDELFSVVARHCGPGGSGASAC